MPDASEPRPPAGEPDVDAVGELVARYVETFEAEGAAAAEAVLEAEPDLAVAVHEQIQRLKSAGFLPGDPAAAATPQVSGYTILERLGAGGMGEVFLAQQREPVRRRVALKVIKLGITSREVVARFEIERQALAMMSHGNIARVLDAGSTAQGQPYFAMEYVPGLPITDYCDSRCLPTRERLALMLAVCDAVQHAHFKGVIHRDLKPSNVLVMEVDGRPTPKIIDFGVAKAVAMGIGGSTVYTAHGMMVGTPEYMSPEQAGRGELDVDTRTDVYSLGVMLYELLTGSLPFPSERLRAGGLQQMLSIIRDEPPPRPSTRISVRSPDTERLASARSTDLGSLRQHLRGDLDWVVLKALEKDRSRRYQTPALLADDLRRYLADQTVAARPPSLGYRAAKFVRRHRVSVALAGAALLAVAAGVITGAVLYRRAETNAASAEAARAVAQANLESAIRAVDDLLSEVGSSSLVHVPQAQGVRRELLRRALQFYEGFVAQRSDDPALRVELASAQARLGRIEHQLGETRSALARYRDAIAQFDDLLAVDPGNVRATERRAAVQAQLGHALTLAGEPGAGPLCEAAVATLQRLCDGPEPSRFQRMALADALVQLAEIRGNEDPAEALALARRALASVGSVVAAEPEAVEPAVKSVLVRFAAAQYEVLLGEIRTAEATLLEADADAKALLAKAPERVDVRRARCLVQDKLAPLYARSGRPNEALAASRESVARWRELAQAFPLSTTFRGSLARSLTHCADSLPVDDPAAVGAMLREAAAIYEEVCREEQSNTEHHRGLAVALLLQAEHGAAGTSAAATRDALGLVQRARDVAARLLADQPDDVATVRIAVAAASRAGALHERLGEVEAARQRLVEASETAGAFASRHAGTPGVLELHLQARLDLASFDVRAGDAASASALASASAEEAQRALDGDPERSGVRRLLARAHNVRCLAAVQQRDAAAARAAWSAVRAASAAAPELVAAARLAATCAAGIDAEAAWFADEAVGALRAAVAAGFADRERIEADAGFAPLRGNPGFASVLAEMQRD